MSFILDALKKSEEQRRRGEMPDLRTEHAASPPSRPRQFFWPALLAVALLINALLLLWWSPWQARVPVAVPAAVPIGTESPPVSAGASSPQTAVEAAAVDGGEAAAEIRAIPAVDEPAGWSDLRRVPPAQAPKLAVPGASARTRVGRPDRPPPTLPHLRDLPDTLRRALPDLSISLHYYDPDPGSRMIRLNGRILREGSTITEGLAVEEITAAGVILNWQGERFFAGDF